MDFFMNYLICPETKEEFEKINDELVTKKSKRKYPIIDNIPRFVEQENYAFSFGYEWEKHYKTQYDSYTKTTISADRFFEETGWSKDLKGQLLLEIGSGSGRFTEIALSTGAKVISFDYSNAVESNFKSNGKNNNLYLFQGSVYSMPLKEAIFDKIFCFGMIQHTPYPKQAFVEIVKYLKPGGCLVVDTYRKNLLRYLVPKYIARNITCHINPVKLYAFSKKYVDLMWPMSNIITKLPFGSLISRNILMVANYSGFYPLEKKILKEWAYLDTFDNLSPKYEKPPTESEMIQWFQNTGFSKIKSFYRKSTLVVRGVKN